MPVPICFTKAGVQYRVLDARMHEGRMLVANRPAHWAVCGVFRPREGVRRLYYFKPGEPPAPNGAELKRQLHVAEGLPAEGFEAPNPDLR